jgi:hypothetical protein
VRGFSDPYLAHRPDQLEQMLGSDHSLTRVSVRGQRRRDALVFAVACLAASIDAVANRAPRAGFVAVCAIVFTVTELLLVARVQIEQRIEARRLIASGRSALPIRQVAVERERLTDPSARVRLAGDVRTAVEDAARWSGDARRSAASVAVAANRELAVAVADAAVDPRSDARGLAMLEELLEQTRRPASASTDSEQFHAELRRVHYYLASIRPPAPALVGTG